MEDNKIRNGKFINKKHIDFPASDIQTLEALASKLKTIFGDKFKVELLTNTDTDEPMRYSIYPYSTLQVTIKNCSGTMRRGSGDHRGYRLRLKPEAQVIITFRNETGYDEITNEPDTQVTCDIRFPGCLECPYKHKTFSSYTTLPSVHTYDYAYKLETIIEETVIPAIETFHRDYNILLNK